MLQIIKFLGIFFCVFLGTFFQISYAAINYSVTPIKYELNLQPGESITLPASIRNNGANTVTLPTTASDFQSTGTSGIPSLVRKSELVYPDQQLSSWINIADNSVTLNPGQEITTSFTIQVPVTATPGGHYGAVLFKNAGSERSTGGNIDINVDYGIIILVNVAGEVYVGAEIGDPIISGGGTGGYNNLDETENNEITEGSDNGDAQTNGDIDGDDLENNGGAQEGWYIGLDGNGNPIFVFPDQCTLGDFTPSKYDGACFGEGDPTLFSDDDISQTNEFEVNFQFPIKNIGNTHIKPSGRIILKDENGVIKAIGKETIANDRGAVIGEEIVDYIPINDQGGNVLPSSKRIFESNWEGFPYKTFDDQGNPVVNYWTPSEYYTQKNKNDAGFLMFWERVSESRTHKNITADIELIYYDEEGNPIEFNTSKTFTVQYIEQVVSINPYIILGLLLVATAILLTLGAIRWWIILFKENRCWNCDEKIKSHWKTCPHCKAIQNKRKHKAFIKQKEAAETINIKEVKKVRKTPSKTKASTSKTVKKKVTTTRKTSSK